jgi:CelD/BcsL family acetyltransferase involved in cellulose biosynthesis
MGTAPQVRRPSQLQARTVAIPDLPTGLLAAWRELESGAVEPNPFFGPDLLLAAARNLPGGSRVRLLVVERGEDVVLALPLLRQRHRRVPLPAATTWQHTYRYVGTPLVRPDALDDAPEQALVLLADLAPWLVLDQLYLDGPVAQAFARAAARRGALWTSYGVWDRPVVHHTDTGSATGALSARSAKGLRRQRRHLESDLGPVRSHDTQRTEPGGLSQQVEAFLALEQAGWKGCAGTALASRAGDTAFFRELCAALGAAGRLELWRLDAGAAVAARQCHVVAGDTVFHLKTTYDEGLARYSPGVQLELDVLGAFHADPRLRHLDPCTDDEPGTSARLYAQRRRTGVALVGLRASGRWAARATPLAARAWRTVRR